MIKWFKRLTIFILFSTAFFIGWAFTSQNNQPTTLILFGYAFPELMLGVWIVLVLLLGALVGLLLSFVPLFLGQQSKAAKDRKIRRLEQELNQLRSSSLKG